jgi:hypothetical protein
MNRQFTRTEYDALPIREELEFDPTPGAWYKSAVYPTLVFRCADDELSKRARWEAFGLEIIDFGSQFYPDPESAMTASEVIVSENNPQPTGLFDALGRPLYRVRDTVPIGFHGKARN